MKILIINSAEPNVRDFVDPIKEALNGMNVDIDIHEWREIFDDDAFEKYAAVIISASPRGNNANLEDRLKSFEWIKTTTKPVLGICAGHQIIGCIFGSTLIKNQEIEDGILPVHIQTDDLIFKGYTNQFDVDQSHVDSVTLPVDFELLASSPQCRVQAMRHKERLIYSVQWHAEKSTQEIIRNYIVIAREYQAS